MEKSVPRGSFAYRNRLSLHPSPPSVIKWLRRAAAVAKCSDILRSVSTTFGNGGFVTTAAVKFPKAYICKTFFFFWVVCVAHPKLIIMFFPRHLGFFFVESDRKFNLELCGYVCGTTDVVRLLSLRPFKIEMFPL